jgi:anti-sigma factor (TIGR02949 family)
MTHLSHLNRYTCEEAFRRLDDYLDRELTPDETVLVQQHLEICAGCAREFNFEASVLRGVRDKLQQIDVPASLQSRILGVLNDQR